MRLPIAIGLAALAFFGAPAWGGENPEAPRVLILNSYHQGFGWSDRELSGLRDTLLKKYPKVEILIEYMDTKRRFRSTLFDELSRLYARKYQGDPFDLIFAADDNAFQFLKSYRRELFGTTPVVFCGLNFFRPELLQGMTAITGVAEFYDIRNTLKLMKKLQPGLKKAVVVTDLTPSGQLLLGQMKGIMAEFGGSIEFEILSGLPLPELERRLSRLSSDQAVFLLNCFRDPTGTYYQPETAMARLSRASSAPIYGFNEFYMGHGQLGGMIGEGYFQGRLAAELGLRILAGEDPAAMPVRVEWPSRLMVDYREMARFGLKLADLPPEALVLNHRNGKQQEILLLHSCDPGFPWTARLNEGLLKELERRPDVGEIFVEYMDAKRYSSSAYFHRLYELYQLKYGHKNFGLILVTDDDAFNFARQYRKLLFKDVPIVFCGVSYLADKEKINAEGITGIVESTDMIGTLNAILDLYPETEKILVINDRTSVGVQYHRRLDLFVPVLKKPVSLVFTYDLDMDAILALVAALDEKTAVFFLTLTRDARNNHYPAPESLRRISAASSRPLFGLHESHLKNGLAGGSISNGVEHGLMAARLAARILDGEKAERLPIIAESPHRFIFSYPVLARFSVPFDRLPPESLLLDSPTAFFSQHREKLVWIAALVMALSITVVFQGLRLRRKEKYRREMESEARIDGLTGAIVRKHFAPEIQELRERSLAEGRKFALCYCDVNHLKYVNDTFGHPEGDRYLRAMVDLIRSSIRSSDRIYRVGGDEFIVLFAGCDKTRVGGHVENINRELGLLNSRPDSPYARGLSFGVAEFDPACPRSIEALLEGADQAMYLNKNLGAVPDGREKIFSPIIGL
ncbi:MAG: diguanylate cyclase [Deltaproteobacteria bacterium]|nr:diguanylate cyclase [Deltaproteobacteria bacterium]